MLQSVASLADLSDTHIVPSVAFQASQLHNGVQRADELQEQ